MKIKNCKSSKQGRRNKNFTKNKNTKIDYKFLKAHPEKQEAFDKEITRFVIEHNPTYPALAEHIFELYTRITSRSIDERQDWFQEEQTSLLKHIDETNDAQ
jgi:hypothetical protein